MKFKTQFNLKYKGTKNGEVNTMDTCTQPDDCLSLRQLLQNHTRNIGSSVASLPYIYTGELVKANFADITDEVEYQKALAEESKRISQKIKDDEKKNKENKERELEAKLQEQQKKDPIPDTKRSDDRGVQTDPS